MNRSEMFAAIDADPIKELEMHHKPSQNITRLPEHMQPGIARYIILGIKPGSFLTAVFANEFEIATIKADEMNAELLDVYRDFLETDVPKPCWGSSRMVREWCERGGLVGKKGAA